MADKIDEAIATAAAPKVQDSGRIQVGLLDDRVARLEFPVPLYAQDIVRITKALNDIWGQMPKEELPAPASPLVVATGPLPKPS